MKASKLRPAVRYSLRSPRSVLNTPKSLWTSKKYSRTFRTSRGSGTESLTACLTQTSLKRSTDVCKDETELVVAAAAGCDELVVDAEHFGCIVDSDYLYVMLFMLVSGDNF